MERQSGRYRLSYILLKSDQRPDGMIVFAFSRVGFLMIALMLAIASAQAQELPQHSQSGAPLQVLPITGSIPMI